MLIIDVSTLMASDRLFSQIVKNNSFYMLYLYGSELHRISKKSN